MKECPKCENHTLSYEGEGYWLCGICGYDEWEELDGDSK